MDDALGGLANGRAISTGRSLTKSGHGEDAIDVAFGGKADMG
jgi:hypothetical protein